MYAQELATWLFLVGSLLALFVSVSALRQQDVWTVEAVASVVSNLCFCVASAVYLVPTASLPVAPVGPLTPTAYTAVPTGSPPHAEFYTPGPAFLTPRFRPSSIRRGFMPAASTGTPWQV